ncbi:hypothetical protein D7U74_16815 [Stenotrophomonas maltophilia]|uniref:hypothetical protein n=1 Tax=Stenotrophomonas maltophilia TaxID=40324 RepID=UPI0015E01A4A|nr:hypothetical protein [Stenotrophomonas maltophilia]MBA0223209.1 hypothetical protein [Stenotrophomonas maltophilia]
MIPDFQSLDEAARHLRLEGKKGPVRCRVNGNVWEVWQDGRARGGQQLRGGQLLAADEQAEEQCGNCGSDNARLRVRGSVGSRRAAQVVCARCGAHGELWIGTDAEAQASRAWAQKPFAMPTPRVITPTRCRAVKLESDLQRDPLELIARMAVGGSYRIPTPGRSTAPLLSAADVSGAVGMMRDSVAKQTALAVALRADGGALLALGRSAARRVLRDCLRRGASSPLKMSDPADRWRMRLVLQDAVNDLVWPERKVPAQVAARAAKMRKGDYLRVHRMATSVLSQSLEDGRKEFRIRLFSSL